MILQRAFFTFLILIIPLLGLTQVANKADDYYKYEQYSYAVPEYKKAYSNTPNKVEKKRILFQISECYRLMKDVRRAEQQYRRLIRVKYSDPIIFLYYAEVLRDQEKYQEAIKQYKKYVKMVPEDPRGTLGIESVRNAIKWKKNPTRYEVANIRKINSRQDDFSPNYGDKKFKTLVFTSSRKDSENKEDPNTGDGYTWLYSTAKDAKGNWSRPQILDEDGLINTSNENTGSATFNRKFNTLYFTRCMVKKNTILGCDVFTSKRRGNNTWGEPVALQITADSIRSGHPAIYDNERTMFFTSDLPKGYGGRDIWVVKRRRKSKPFGKPKNLGENINSTGDERYPVIRRTRDREHVYLYFSSNGRGGMGGWDMFRSELVDDKWTPAENLGYPLNSSSDDFGIVFNKSRKLTKQLRSRQIINCEEMGFLTTNRSGGRGRFDIWEFWLPEVIFTLAGTIRDESTIQFLPKSKIILSGTDGSVLVTTTDQRGYYFFNRDQINKNTTYTLKVSHGGYFENGGSETTVGRTESEDIILDINLKPIPPDPIPLPEIRFKLAKWDLQPQYQDSLNGLIKTMNDNPKLVVELGAHTDYQDDAIKNDTLSFRRASSVVTFLTTKGIAAARMVAKGYGENSPRLLKKGYTYSKGSDYAGVSFPPGTVLTEDYIKTVLKTTKQRKAANQLNRRITFKILRNDYVPKNSNDTLEAIISINPDENKVPFEIVRDTIYAECILNNNTYSFAYVKKAKELTLSLDVVMGLIAQHRLNVKSFEKGKDAFTEDGTVKDGAKFTVQRMRIGNKTVYDQTATCVHGGAGIILGRTTLNNFSGFIINKTDKVIVFDE